MTFVDISAILMSMENEQKDQTTAKEAKRQRFLRLATLRTNLILDRLRVLGHCANKSAYNYTDEDVEKIFDELEDELRITKSKFKSREKRKITLN